MQRRTWFVTTLGLLLLISGVASAHHRPGHTGGPTPTLTISPAPTSVVYGGTVVFSGRLSGTNNDRNQLVVLQGDPFPYNTFVPGPTTRTNTSGNYTFVPVRPDRNTQYRTQSGSLTSRTVLIGVRLAVSLSVSDSTPARGQRVRFSGRARPKHNGTLVRIQRLDSAGIWRTVGTTTTQNVVGSNSSSYSKTLRVYSDGTYRARVNSGDADHWSGVSRTRFLNVP